MPDISDIEAAFVGIIGAALTGSAYVPGTIAAGPGGNVLVVRGWPDSAKLMADLSQGTSHVTVFPDAGMARDTTRYLPLDGAPIAPAAPTLTLTLSGRTLTIGGTPAAGYLCGVLLGPLGRGVAAPYAVTGTDTLPSIAAALAALVGGTAAGAVMTLPTDLAVARVVQPVATSREVRRQEQVIRVSCWCPSPQARDVVASAVDLAFAPYVRFTLASGYVVTIRYRGTRTDDQPSKSTAWRRDLLYCVEYPTAPQTTAAQMLFGDLNTGPAAPFAA